MLLNFCAVNLVLPWLIEQKVSLWGKYVNGVILEHYREHDTLVG